jgi:hypothetical protein
MIHYKIKENGFGLVKFLYFLEEEFDENINNNTIPKITYKSFNSKMKNIRYIILFYFSEHPLYIYDLDLVKIIDVQKCIILYQINCYNFKNHFTIPVVEYYDFC